MASLPKNLIVRQSKSILTAKLLLLTFITSVMTLAIIFLTDDVEIHIGENIWGVVSSDIIIFLLSFSVAAIIALYLIFQWRNLYYEIKDGEIVFYQGILIKRRRVYALENLENVTCLQSFVGKWFNFGTLELQKRFEQHNEFIPYLPDPQRIQDEIVEAANLTKRVGRSVSM